MSESEEPDWLAKDGEAVRRELLPLVRAVDQIVRDARLAKASGGPALPTVQRVALAVDAAMREILPARMDATAQPATLEVSVAFPAVIIGSGGVTLPPMRLGGQGTVQDRGHRRAPAHRGDPVAARAGGSRSDNEGESVIGRHGDAGCLLRSYRRDRRGGHHRLPPEAQ